MDECDVQLVKHLIAREFSPVILFRISSCIYICWQYKYVVLRRY